MPLGTMKCLSGGCAVGGLNGNSIPSSYKSIVITPSSPIVIPGTAQNRQGSLQRICCIVLFQTIPVWESQSPCQGVPMAYTPPHQDTRFAPNKHTLIQPRYRWVQHTIVSLSKSSTIIGGGDFFRLAGSPNIFIPLKINV